jgi:Tfp pilus assembly protein PilF/peroxiredoxin
MRATRLISIALALFVPAPMSVSSSAAQEPERPGERPSFYRPKLNVPESLQPFVKHVKPGGDSFPEEKEAEEFAGHLAELSRRLRQDPDRAAEVPDFLLASTFRGARLQANDEVATAQSPSLQIQRAGTAAQELTLDPRAFASELRSFVKDFRQVTTADFLVTAIDLKGDEGRASTSVRYEIVGPGKEAWRAERSGVWQMRWGKGPSGWRVTEWTAVKGVRSRASTPVFSEITTAALGANDSFRRQLSTGLDAWVATIDSALTRDSNGHHGVAVGDADGDGLEDLYIAQPSGLPNRLFRARGDGTFEDATERAGLAVLDDTSQSLFADVDNDDDQDLILVTSGGPVVFQNEGRGRFDAILGSFRFKRSLQGTPMSITMADYDRDGFLDVYLCVYAFYFGAGEGKAGTPMPYHDARNGPPSVLFRNDGHGRFEDVTEEAGLDPTNDRYHFAAAWGDYDADGWPDLYVANDFGTKNLYRNLGRRDGKVRFEEVSEKAGVLDHGAGMSAAFFDYDNDGRLDIYTGNIWSHNGLRVTGQPAFMPDAPEAVRALYRRHARGNSLFRNRGDGTFEDVTLAAGAEMGRWAWSSDTLDFDSDGWDDIYVANGMLTHESGPEDIDGFFWRQVVARSPLTRVTGTPYDTAWRAMNQLLIRDSIAARQRNVFLRNDGRGGFDDVSGTVGLDLDQDGRSFGVLDFDQDGDPDVAVMAARGLPQLRLFRNDFKDRGAALTVRLVGSGKAGASADGGFASNRDAVGARVSIETDRLRRVKTVQAGSGFISQHSKDLLFGLGASQRVVSLTVEWPSGRKQVFGDVPLNQRLMIQEGAEPRFEPFPPSRALKADVGLAQAVAPPSTTWFYEPFPAPDFSLKDLRGEMHSLSDLRGRPVVVLLWAEDASDSRAALRALARGADALAQAGVASLAISLDAAENLSKVRAAAAGLTSLPVLLATEEVGRSYATMNRHLYMNRQDLLLPTAFLVDAAGGVVRAYRGAVDPSEIARDAARIDAMPRERLARALPFDGALYSEPGARGYLSYGRELLDQGLEAAAVVAFERAAQGNPSASTLYQLGTLLVRSQQPVKARAAFERALEIQPDLSEAANDLGTVLAQDGDIPGAIERFRAAIRATPDYPDALNNLGYALLLSGEAQEARDLYEKALKLQPDFPEALNNLGLILAREGDMDRAEPYFRKALSHRPDYSEAANNLALVLVRRGQTDAAIRLLETFIEAHPAAEDSYITLARIHISRDARPQGLAVIERLLQRKPTHSVALEMVRLLKP